MVLPGWAARPQGLPAPARGASGTGPSGAAAKAATRPARDRGADAGASRDAGRRNGRRRGAGGAIAQTGPRAVMYLPNWAGSFSMWATKIDFTKMTHLLLAFGTGTAGTQRLEPRRVRQRRAGARRSRARRAREDPRLDRRRPTTTSASSTAIRPPSNIGPLVANLDVRS